MAAALLAGVLIAQQVAARALRDSLFLGAFEVSSLPAMFVASALVSLLGALGFASAQARRAPSAVLAGALGLQAVLFVAEWRLAAQQPRGVAVALYVQLALLGPGILSAFWSLVNERFDPHTARRVMGRIGTGASLGGVAGGALAWLAARWLPVTDLLLGLSAASLLALVALPRFRSAGTRLDAGGEPARGTLTRLDPIWKFPYLRQLAALVTLGALADVLLDYLLKAGATRSFQGSAELTGFFSMFYASVALLTLAVQALLTRRALEALGLSGTAALQPAALALASAAGLLLPSFAAAITARGLGVALRDSLFRSAYELFFTPLPPWQKRPGKALVDIAADRLGVLAGASAVWLLAAWSARPERWLWLTAVVAMSASALVARRLHAGYVSALEHSLRSGLVALDPDEAVDSTTRYTLTRTALDRESLLAEIRALHGETAPDPVAPLREVLGSGRADLIRRALATRAPLDPSVAPLLLPLLGRAELSHDALRALRRLAPQVVDLMVARLSAAETPVAVRRRIPRVLKAAPVPRAIEGLLTGLADADFDVRRACGTVLAWIRERHPTLEVPAPAVYAAVGRELEAPAADREACLDHVFALLSALGEVEPLRAARWALHGQDQRLKGTALEYLEQVLPDDVRGPLLRRIGESASARPRARDVVEDELRRTALSLPRGLAVRRRG